MAKVEGEQAKVSVRHVRKLAMDSAKKLASEDERKRVEKEVQRLTDDYIAQVQVGGGGWAAGTGSHLLHASRRNGGPPCCFSHPTD